MALERVDPQPAAGVTSWSEDTDVVVVGLGCAGAAAAFEARRGGAEVLVLERSGAGGGASAMSGGILYLGGGTSVQKACGFEDSAESMFTFLMAAMGPGPDEPRIAAYADGSVELFNWLVERGVSFKPTMWAEPAWTPPTEDGLMWMGENSHPFCELTTPAPRGHRPQGTGRTGGALMTPLIASVIAAGATVRGDTGVERLVVEEDGRVVGVVARHFGDRLTIRARGGVVLTGGGFVFNDEMLATHAPHLVGHSKIGTDHDDGRVIRMAQAVGGATRRMDAGEASINLSPAVMARGIVVNAQGQRFINEDTYPGRIGQAALFHQAARAYLVFDEEAYESVPENLRHGRVPQWVCETTEELEQEMELPAGCLQATIDLYNRHAEHGRDPLFHKQPKWLRPLRAPFGAMDARAPRLDGAPDPADKATGFRVFTLGGLQTGLDGSVLDTALDPIPGLYAAGRTTSGIQGWGYISGTSLGDGTFFGRRAGAAAAAAVERVLG